MTRQDQSSTFLLAPLDTKTQQPCLLPGLGSARRAWDSSLLQQLQASNSDKTTPPSALIPGTHIMSSICRHKDLLLQELVSLSAEEVYTILCLPAMSQEHVLTAPLPEGTHSITLAATCVTAKDLVPAPGPGNNIIMALLMQAPAFAQQCNS